MSELSLNSLQKGKADINHNHDYTKLNNLPTLASVATSGDYNDLLNKPSANQTTNPVAGLPVGIPFPWFNDVFPANTLECNGQNFNTITYPDLAKVFPSGKLPDLRGVALRGLDRGRGLDIDGVNRKAGDYQADELKSHKHNSLIDTWNPMVSSLLVQTGTNAGVFQGSTSTPLISLTGGTETRMKNVACYWLVYSANTSYTTTPIVIDPSSNGIGLTGTSNCIVNGLDFNYQNGLSINVNAGRAIIGENSITTSTPQQLALNPRSSSLVYMKNDGSINKIDAILPEPDDNTVCQWRFNKTGNISNYALGNGLAVANDLVPSGTLSLVDGWNDYAILGDGTTGGYISQNMANFPIGNAEREIDIIITILESTSADRVFCSYGTYSSMTGFGLYQNGLNLRITYGYGDGDLYYQLEIGKTYFISLLFNGRNIMLYINGVLITSFANTLATTSSYCYVLKHSNNALNSKSIIHYAEIRNKCRTSYQIAKIANQLCFPVTYNAPSSTYPPTPTDAGYHEYKFDEVSGNTFADSSGTLNATGVTGEKMVASDLGLGNAWYMNGNDYATLGSYAFNSEFTILAVINVKATPTIANPIISSFNGDTTGLHFGVYLDNRLVLSSGADIFSKSTIAMNKPVFCATTVKSNICSFYVDSPIPEVIGSFTPFTATDTYMLGYSKYGTNASSYFNGNFEYLLIIPRALSQAEIAQIYNKLMKTTKKDIREILPTDTISKGFIRTDSARVIEYDEKSYKYGIRYADKQNKKINPDFRYVTSNQKYTFNNPFGTNLIDIKIFYKKNLSDYQISRSDMYSYSEVGTILKSITSDKITISTLANGIIQSYYSYTNALETSGYIGIYAEVIDD